MTGEHAIRLVDEDEFFVDTPKAVAEAVAVVEHLLGDPAVPRLLGEHYMGALHRVLRQARRDLDEHDRMTFGSH